MQRAASARPAARRRRRQRDQQRQHQQHVLTVAHLQVVQIVAAEGLNPAVEQRQGEGQHGEADDDGRQDQGLGHGIGVRLPRWRAPR